MLSRAHWWARPLPQLALLTALTCLPPVVMWVTSASCSPWLLWLLMLWMTVMSSRPCLMNFLHDMLNLFFCCCCCCCSSGRYPCLTRLTGATEVVGEQAIRQAWEVQDSFPCSFLGYVMAQWKLQPCPAKIRAGEEWPRPTTRKQLQHFLGFTNFYRRFIRGYSCVAVPLSKLTSIGSNFTWSPEVDTAFQRLNPLFTETPVLQHPNPLPQTEEISLW